MRFIRVGIIFPTYSTRREVVFLNRLLNQRIIYNMGYKYPVTNRKMNVAEGTTLSLGLRSYHVYYKS